MPARVRGNFKSLLQRLPDAVEAEIRQQLNDTGKMLLARARARAPVYQGKPRKGRTAGALRAALSYKVPPKRLNLRVGVIGKPAMRRVFYGAFVEFGHRIAHGSRLEPVQRIAARPGSRAFRLAMARRRAGAGGDYVRPRPFLYTMSRAEIYAPFQKIWGRAIHNAAAGASDQ
jgi:hypothetical protein